MTTAEKIGSLTYEDMRSMKTSELESWIKKGTGVLNPRIDRLSRHVKKEDVALDAYKAVIKSGGKFGFSKLKHGLDITNFKDAATYRNRLVKELSRMSKFANYKTSTITGARKVQKQREKIIGDKTEGSAQERSKRASEAWRLFNKFQDYAQSSGYYVPSEELREWFEQNIMDSDESDFDAMLEQMKIDLAMKREKMFEGFDEAYENTEYKPKWKSMF